MSIPQIIDASGNPEGWIKAVDMTVEDWIELLGCDVIEAEQLWASYNLKNHHLGCCYVVNEDGTMEPM